MNNNYYLGTTELDKFLHQQGFEISKATLLRYVQCGLMLQPQKKSTLGTLDSDRIYYHPLVCIEAMANYLLMRGDWLVQDSDTRIARFSTEDIFYARLKFYAYIDQVKIMHFNFSDYSSCIRKPIGKKLINFPLRMENIDFLKNLTNDLLQDDTTEDVKNEILSSGDYCEMAKIYVIQDRSQYIKNLLHGIPDEDAKRVYCDCSYLLYKETFEHLLEKYHAQLSTYKY